MGSKELVCQYSSFTYQIRTEILSQTQDNIHKDGTDICPDVKTPVLVGTIGISNFTRHQPLTMKFTWSMTA